MRVWQFTKQNILPVIAGGICAVITVALIEIVGHAIYPPPADIDLSNRAEIAKLIKTLPLGALLFVVFAWGAGSFVGALISTLLSFRRSLVPGMIVGVFILAATLATLLSIPHPAWMFIAGLILPVPVAFLGVKLAHQLNGV